MGISISSISNISGRSYINNIGIKTMKKWFTETRNVDIETGENLSKARLEREALDWIKTGSSYTTQDCGAYMLKIHTNHYEKNKQTRLTFE